MDEIIIDMRISSEENDTIRAEMIKSDDLCFKINTTHLHSPEFNQYVSNG